MARNVYFSHGTKNEQYLLEDIIVESLSIYGQDFFYIPRTLISKDNILGEDRLSQFKEAYPIEMYLENNDGFEGQGAFMQKFGLMVEQTATLTVARRRWEQLVGRFGQTIIPTRPAEGDLIYFPLTRGLFEIKFVQHQDPFYQLGKLYVYKLQVELFQYSSERLDTGIEEIDVLEQAHTNSVTITEDGILPFQGSLLAINVTSQGSGYLFPPKVTIQGDGFGAAAVAVMGTTSSTSDKVVAIKVLNSGESYKTIPTIVIEPSQTGGNNATAFAIMRDDVEADKAEEYGNNSSFKQEASDIVFSESNPFGDVITGVKYPALPKYQEFYVSSDSTFITVDLTTITADRNNG